MSSSGRWPPARLLMLLWLLALPGAAAAAEQQTLVVDPNQFLSCPPAGEMQEEMVRLVNETRASGRQCGGRHFAAVPPVVWAVPLAAVAEARSTEMAKGDFLRHTGPYGRGIGEHVRDAGYQWAVVGENIAGGLETVQTTVKHWLQSPDHCENLMTPGYREMGAACARNRQSTYGTYWTLILAAPEDR